MKKIFISTLAILLFTINAYAGASSLCDGRTEGRQLSFSKSLQDLNSENLTLINWNAHKLGDKKFLPDLLKLSADADIITIQESMHSDDYQTAFESNFAFNFSFNMSFCDKNKQATGVMNMARYNIEANKTLVSPDKEPITNTPKVSGYSAVQVPNLGLVHIINIHALNFNLGSKFERHVDSVGEFIKTLEGPVIWTGDFNTWNSTRKKHLDRLAKTLGLTQVNLANDKRNLKLDHVYVRGLEVISAELLNGYKSSDHLPIKVIFKKK